MSYDSWDAIVIGGGFYGCQIALDLRRHGLTKVALLEREGMLLQRASYYNQARVHNGYHYPRSLLTAFRSRCNFGRFVSEYREAICSSFQSVYGVARQYSNVSARQFAEFCKRIDAPLVPASDAVRNLFDSHMIEDVCLVTEYAFNAITLRQMMERKLAEAGVSVSYLTDVKRLSKMFSGEIAVETVGGDSADLPVMSARQVFNCTYSRLNEVLHASGLPLIALKHELTEIALIQPPEELRAMAITIMCGPFFSCMPFPSSSLHSLSHVLYTPRGAWSDRIPEGRPLEELKHSKAVHMLQDARRFLPSLQKARYERSLWEVKTVLPQSDVDDSRPILFRANHGLDGLHCVLGSKIDNVFDMCDEIHQELHL